MSYISSERKKMLFESWLNEEPDSLLWLQTKKLPEVYFGGIYLELEIKGNCEVVLANQKFTIENSETERYKHQLMLYNSTPSFSITAKDKCEISNIRLRLAEF